VMSKACSNRDDCNHRVLVQQFERAYVTHVTPVLGGFESASACRRRPLSPSTPAAVSARATEAGATKVASGYIGG
jgi:hypothetical protein